MRRRILRAGRQERRDQNLERILGLLVRNLLDGGQFQAGERTSERAHDPFDFSGGWLAQRAFHARQGTTKDTTITKCILDLTSVGVARDLRGRSDSWSWFVLHWTGVSGA